MDILFAPICIAFLVIIIGYYLGQIKFASISLDIAGILIIAVATGYVLNSIETTRNVLNTSDFQRNMQFFSSLGTALFVSTIGITTGNSINARKRRDIIPVLIGSMMVLSSFITMKMILSFDPNISFSKLFGSLCGALTTTPGLSAVSELPGIVVEEAILGYGSSYLFGVVTTVLFVQVTARKTINLCEEKYHPLENDSHAAMGGIIQIGISVIVGRLLGNLGLFGFSLGNSGGMLCAGILIGWLLQTYFPHKKASTNVLGVIRNFGLAMFFVGNGIPAGMLVHSGFDIEIVLYGALMTITPLFFGLFLCRIMNSRKSATSIIAGGMTSTPAIGVLMQMKCDIQLNSYSLAYVGALFTVIASIRMS